nr:ubiquinol oxidase subunit II [Sphingomonas laterariae]
MRALRGARPLALLSALALLGGCNAVVLDPAGDIAQQQAWLIVASTVLMLVIIVPVMALTVLFAWRYRQSNKEARYEPEWDHSTQLELLIWAAPLLIIICLGALTWVSTHLLDPYRPIARVAEGKPIAAEVEPLEVEVVALDWKWLFIYPQYGVATVNELAAPVDRPINFRITSSSVMNSFYVPALAGMIYAMPGMETKLHAVINKAGNYEGFSANYSGAGFSGMRFRFHGLNDAQFAEWVAKAKAGNGPLDRNVYLKLEQPSENVPVARFAGIEEGLYNAIVNMCVEPGKMCMSEMMAIDAKGGLGKEGIRNVRQLTYDKHARRGAVLASEPVVVGAICAPPAPVRQAAAARPAADQAPLTGAGLPRPGASATADAKPSRPTNS